MPEYKLGRLNGRFVITWWEEGKRRRYRLEADTRGDAEREAIDIAKREQDQPKAALTIAELWDEYRSEKIGRRVATAMKHEWKAIGPHFGHFRPDQITDKLCASYAAKRRKQRPKGKKKGQINDGTIWTELGHLRSVLLWAVERQKIDHAPPIPRPSKPQPKSRWLTHKEIDRLLAVEMAPHIRLAITLMLATAARVGAVLDLKWDRVDFERGKVDLRVTDIGPRKGRAIVPMNDGLRAALLAAKAGAISDYVIEWGGERVQSIKTGFRAACAAAEFADVTPHVLRHTAAVHLAASGARMAKIAQYLGHSNEQITAHVYARFSPEHLKEEAKALDFFGPREVP